MTMPNRPNRRYRDRKKNQYLEYKPKFIVACEGAKTEPQYFECLKAYAPNAIVHVVKRKTGRSYSLQVLADLKKELEKASLSKKDEAWIVIDVDQNETQELSHIVNDAHDFQIRCGISNPKFEYWLLLHFVDPPKNMTSTQCTDAMRVKIPDYDKNVPQSQITRERIEDAIKRAKSRFDSNQKYPTSNGSSVYILVEKIIS
ncbi:MAG: RloB family protein [Aminobacterium colombiense]|nr:RloB family protein [Aminobacterium colombiense]